jgi:hypothetical protein
MKTRAARCRAARFAASLCVLALRHGVAAATPAETLARCALRVSDGAWLTPGEAANSSLVAARDSDALGCARCCCCCAALARAAVRTAAQAA